MVLYLYNNKNNEKYSNFIKDIENNVDKMIKTKFKKMSKILNETKEEVGLYQSYCKDITHIKWD